MSNSTEARERNIAQYVGKCRHFTGFGLLTEERVCNAGIDYAVLNGNSMYGVAVHLPCFRKRWDGSVSCEKVDYIERAEAEEQVDRDTARLAEYVERVYTNRICPSCNEKYAGKQVGPCVYCEHCNARLYQGRVQS